MLGLTKRIVPLISRLNGSNTVLVVNNFLKSQHLKFKNGLFINLFRRKRFLLNVSSAILIALLSLKLCKDQYQCAERRQIFQEMTSEQFKSYCDSDKKEQAIVLISNVFFKKNRQNDQFNKNLFKLSNELNISKIILVFEKSTEQSCSLIKELGQEKDKKQERLFSFYYLNPNFKRIFFFSTSQEAKKQIQVIRRLGPKINIKLLQKEIQKRKKPLSCLQKLTFIKKCPTKLSQQKFQEEILKLKELKELNLNKKEYNFFIIKTNQQQKIVCQALKIDQSLFKNQLLILRQDMLGFQVIQNNQSYYKKSQNIHLEQYFSPRIFILSSEMKNQDYQFFFKLQKTKKGTSLLINNINSFLQNQRVINPNGKTLEMLKIIYKNYPHLNYIIVNDEYLNKMIGSTKKFTFFKIDTQNDFEFKRLQLNTLSYEKMLAEGKPGEQIQKQFLKQEKKKIQTFFINPKTGNRAFLNVQNELNIEALQKIIQSTKIPWVLRVCQGSCISCISHQEYNRLKVQSGIAKQQTLELYWIDSSFQNIGLPEGNYFINGDKPTLIESI